jgi:PEP-CTERM motif
MRTRLAAICLLLFSSGFSGLARADFITSITESNSQSPDGSYNYLYQLDVGQASDALAIVFGVNVGADANLQSFLAPVGWEVDYAVGNLAVIWEATDSTGPIPPGSSGMFGFSSMRGPATTAFAVQGFNPSSFDFPVNQGQTVGPASAVPEPSSLFLLGTGLISLACVAWSRRRPSTRRA